VKLEIIPHAPVSILGQVFHSFACLSTVHNLFQSLFSIECDLVLPLSISSILSSVAACFYLLIFPSHQSSLYLSFHNVSQKAVRTQDVPNPVSQLILAVCGIFLFWTVCNTSLLTWSVQLISIPLQQHYFRTSHFFLICFPKCPSSASYRPLHQMLHFTRVFQPFGAGIFF
jgi:hypothetical protein